MQCISWREKEKRRKPLNTSRKTSKLQNNPNRCLHFSTHLWQFQWHTWCSPLLFWLILLTPVRLLVWKWTTVLSLRSQIENSFPTSLQPQSFCDAAGKGNSHGDRLWKLSFGISEWMLQKGTIHWNKAELWSPTSVPSPTPEEEIQKWYVIS